MDTLHLLWDVVNGAVPDSDELEWMEGALPSDFLARVRHHALRNDDSDPELPPFEAGLLCGRINALTWAMGHSWECRGAFDPELETEPR